MNCRGLPASASVSPAAVVLHSGFGSSTVAVSAVFSFRSMRRSLEAVCGRVRLFSGAALNVTADVVAHLAGRWGGEGKSISSCKIKYFL